MQRKILILDSFDSFTYNIVHMLEALPLNKSIRQKLKVEVETGGIRSAESILEAQYLFVIIGPGPRSPDDLPDLTEQVKALIGHVPLFGICLGHQVLAHIFGSEIVHADAPRHGKQVLISHRAKGLFAYIKQPMKVMCYNSLIAQNICSPLKQIAQDEHKQSMALECVEQKIWAVQFHPESIGTIQGDTLLQNMCELAFKCIY